jgi:hypothetical protein
LAEQGFDIRFVVHHQHCDCHALPPSGAPAAGAVRGMMIVNSMNCSGALSTVSYPPCCFTMMS